MTRSRLLIALVVPFVLINSTTGRAQTGIALTNHLRSGNFTIAEPIAATQERDPTVYEPGNGVTLPRSLKEVKAEYTPEAKAAKIQGTVVVRAIVLSDGTVGDVTILQSLDAKFGLDEQATRATKHWVFEPGRKDGKPVAVRVTIEHTFTLRP